MHEVTAEFTSFEFDRCISYFFFLFFLTIIWAMDHNMGLSMLIGLYLGLR